MLGSVRPSPTNALSAMGSPMLPNRSSFFVNRVGQRFGRLVVVERAESALRPNGKKRTQWLCRCDCGNTKTVLAENLLKRQVKSCGCLNAERAANLNRTHGLCGTPEYITWAAIKQRCFDQGNAAFRLYGARGISMCSRWFYGEGGKTGPECFLADMGPKPSPRHSIDRIDVNGDYEPNNCRWATHKDQANNCRTNVRVSYNGQMMGTRELSKLSGIPADVIGARLRYGWDVERAVTQRIGEKRTRHASRSI